MCHVVLFMPLFALALFWLLPPVLAIPLYLLVLILSAWLYYVVYRVMHRVPVIGPEALLSAHGRVTHADGNNGWVRIKNELWRAESDRALRDGEPVRVVARKGLVLHVMREAPPGAGAPPAARGRPAG